MSDYRIFIRTCDKYINTLRPMAWMMEKYWNPVPKVVVGGYSPPDFHLPDNWTFHSIGKNEDYPFGKWSSATIEFFNSQPDKVFLFMLDDMWPIRPVDIEALDILYQYMLQFEYVAKMDLCADRLYAMDMISYGNVGRIDLVKSMPGSPYHLSLMPGFWRKEHLLSVLIPNESPHEVEMWGTPRLSHKQDVIVLGTRIWPLRVCLALRGGDAGKLLLSEVASEDAQAMRELGYFESWEK